MKVERRTVDLSAYPDLVVIYLGMRVNRLAGLKTILGFGPRISNAVGEKPDGLLLHENLIYSILPHARGNAPVLARFRIPGTPVPLGAAYAVVEGISAQLGRHGLLARDLLHARRDRSHLRRYARPNRARGLCPRSRRPRAAHVFSPRPSEEVERKPGPFPSPKASCIPVLEEEGPRAPERQDGNVAA